MKVLFFNQKTGGVTMKKILDTSKARGKIISEFR